MQNKIVMVLIGAAGCGKSTYTEQFPSYSVINQDTIRAELCGDASDQSKNGEVFKTAISRLHKELNAGNSVIWDNTSRNPKMRKLVVDIAKQHQAKLIAVFFKTPLEVCLERNSKRLRQVPPEIIKKQYTELVEPSFEEGFEQIHFV